MTRTANATTPPPPSSYPAKCTAAAPCLHTTCPASWPPAPQPACLQSSQSWHSAQTLDLVWFRAAGLSLLFSACCLTHDALIFQRRFLDNPRCVRARNSFRCNSPISPMSLTGPSLLAPSCLLCDPLQSCSWASGFLAFGRVSPPRSAPFSPATEIQPVLF